MKIAIDVRTVQKQRAGIGVYTQLLVEALSQVGSAEHFILVGGPDTAWDYLPSGSHITPHTITGSPLVWHWKAAHLAKHVDVYHSPSSLFVPLLVPERSVLTVHDLVPFLMPEVSNAKTWWTHRLFGMTVRRVSAIISDSRHTAQDVRRLFPRMTTSISTVHLAARPEFKPSQLVREAVPDPYFLAVGTLEPRKNLPRLVRAYRSALIADPELPRLVIAGKLGWKNVEFERLMAAPELQGRVHLAGYVPDEELLRLFQGATAFVYPSLYEGFGLPVLEAMACGTPVITSACSSLPEIGGEAALYVDPTDETALYSQLLKIRRPEVRQELSRLGLEQASRFSWQEAARQTLALYHGVGNTTRRASR